MIDISGEISRPDIPDLVPILSRLELCDVELNHDFAAVEMQFDDVMTHVAWISENILDLKKDICST